MFGLERETLGSIRGFARAPMLWLNPPLPEGSLRPCIVKVLLCLRGDPLDDDASTKGILGLARRECSVIGDTVITGEAWDVTVVPAPLFTLGGATGALLPSADSSLAFFWSCLGDLEGEDEEILSELPLALS